MTDPITNLLSTARCYAEEPEGGTLHVCCESIGWVKIKDFAEEDDFTVLRLDHEDDSFTYVARDALRAVRFVPPIEVGIF